MQPRCDHIDEFRSQVAGDLGLQFDAGRVDLRGDLLRSASGWQRNSRKLNASLERRGAERTADMEAVNQELEPFNSCISHDLRAPLGHIDGFSKILVEEHGTEIAEAACRNLDRIREGVRRMGRMVDEWLELSRMARKEVGRQPTGVESLADAVLTALGPEIEGREIEWRSGELPFAGCDPALTRQVFANLLSNAVMEVGQAGDRAVWFVRDKLGFNPKYADRLFGVFQRLHQREDFEGTGVGLATVHRIVHKHGGSIWAEAELNRGATFYFTLDPPDEPRARRNAGSRAVGEILPKDEIEILLVEDDPEELELTMHALNEDHLCNRVQVARDGEEALDFLFSRGPHSRRDPESRPKIILLDLKVPKVDGLEVPEQIRSNPFTKSLAVVILTTSIQEQDMVKSRLGGNSYMQKPVDFDQFGASIQRLGYYRLVVNQPPPQRAFEPDFVK